MARFHPVPILIFLVFAAATVFYGCSEDDAYYKLNGQWEGENSNTATNQKWPFKVAMEHRGTEVTGIYSDYRGSRTLRSVEYDGEAISFILDIWPESVTFIGILRSENSMDGSWSYSGDGNNGEWYLFRDSDPEDDEDDEEESGDESSGTA
ncbi:MAG TPA: hypothetical protein PLV45_00955, partial [bacterium]|nr:hypothetical protein [bacterium]